MAHAEAVIATTATGKALGGERSERERAQDLIMALLTGGGGEIESDHALQAGRAAGFSDSTMQRSKRDLGVRSSPDKQRWYLEDNF